VARSEPDWAHVHAEMKRRGVTLALLWQEYRGDHPQGFAYSWYCESYGGWKKRISPTMRQTHVAGEKLFVDWAGDTIGVIDPATGEERRARIFVAALGASNFTYAEARWSETLPDWIGAHVNALNAIGGVPKALVPDNLKAGVTKPSRYEPGINRTYQDLADHYGCVVLPTRIVKPRDKAKVEVAVQIVERFVLAKLRNVRFFSLAELNVAIRDCVATINAKVMRRLAKSRVELLETIERPALGALPAAAYSYAEWKRARVAPDYHIEIADHFYSVPTNLIREICEALTIMDRTGPLFTGILGRAEMATAVAEQQWDWSDGSCSLDSLGSRAGLAVEAALQASESVPPSPLSADSLEQESPSPRKGGGSLWLSKGDDFGTEVSVGSAHG
jgi:transposase